MDIRSRYVVPTEQIIEAERQKGAAKMASTDIIPKAIKGVEQGLNIGDAVRKLQGARARKAQLAEMLARPDFQVENNAFSGLLGATAMEGEDGASKALNALVSTGNAASRTAAVKPTDPELTRYRTGAADEKEQKAAALLSLNQDIEEQRTALKNAIRSGDKKAIRGAKTELMQLRRQMLSPVQQIEGLQDMGDGLDDTDTTDSNLDAKIAEALRSRGLAVTPEAIAKAKAKLAGK